MRRISDKGIQISLLVVALLALVVAVVQYLVPREQATQAVGKWMPWLVATAALLAMGIAAPRALGRVVRTAARALSRRKSRAVLRQSLMSTPTEVPWLWLRGVSVAESNRLGARYSAGAGSDGEFHVGALIWDAPVQCEGIQISVLIPSSNSIPLPIRAALEICEPNAADSPLITFCIGGEGELWLYHRDIRDPVCHVSGLAVGRWHALRLTRHTNTYSPGVDGADLDPVSAADARGQLWPEKAIFRVRSWAQGVQPNAMFGRPTIFR